MNSRLLQSERIESARQTDIGLTSVEAIDLVRKTHFGYAGIDRLGAILLNAISPPC